MKTEKQGSKEMEGFCFPLTFLIASSLAAPHFLLPSLVSPAFHRLSNTRLVVFLSLLIFYHPLRWSTVYIYIYF